MQNVDLMVFSAINNSIIDTQNISIIHFIIFSHHFISEVRKKILTQKSIRVFLTHILVQFQIIDFS